MRFPIRDLRRAVEEQGALRGKTVDNVYQCDRRTFLLKLRPGPVHLLVDAHAGRARAVVTDRPPAVPDQPPVLGAILRRALRGGRVLGSTLLQDDRVIALDIGAGEPRRLLLEAFPRHPNLYLLDAGGRVDRVLDGDAARHRGNPVGSTYELPKPPPAREEESVLPDDLSADEPFAANHALDALARGEREERREKKQGRDLAKVVARLEKTRGATERDLRALPEPDRLRRQGELLLQHYPELRQGMKSFQGVPLDPKRSPQENVDAVFRKARKAERGRPELARRLKELDGLLARLKAGEDVPERELPGRAKRAAKPKERRRPYRVFRSADGRRILVGRGGADNDETTLRVGRPHDVFLHVRGTPGAHVIVPLDKSEEIPEQTLLDAATLAMHYSKMRTAAVADVTWCARKYVSKPRGAKPGLVQVQREKVLRLRREPDRLARLLMAME